MDASNETKPGSAFAKVVALVERLLSKDGCPWDRKQTIDSLKPFLIEESYEVLEAIEQSDTQGHCEELGDVLFQIVFQSALRSQKHEFTIDDVCHRIVEKMERRHPHIFGDQKVKDAEEVKVLWGQLKEAERKQSKTPKHVLHGIPKQLPALLYAHQLGEKAAQVGFDWPDVAGVRVKVAEEMAELDEAIALGNKKEIAHELGDVLFTLTRLAGKLGLSAEDALRTANARFIRRFEGVEALVAEDGREMKQMRLEEFDKYWQKVKQEEKNPALEGKKPELPSREG